MKTRHTFLTACYWLAVLMLSCTVSQHALAITVNENVAVPMRDGVILRANVFRPDQEGAYPVILMRTPYGKGGPNHGEARGLAENGYVYVAQDCRGRGQSEGTWYPGINERHDGLDTHQWILAQPWCNGSIGTAGGSYVGYTQWITAPDAGDHLKAMLTAVPLFDWYEGCCYIDGALNYAQMMDWGMGMAIPPQGHAGIDRRTWNREKAHRYLPLSTWDEQLGFEVKYLRDWVAHPEFDDYWQQYRMTDALDRISTPNLTISGWYDIFVNQAFENIGRIRRESRSALARKHQYLIVGPWTHGAGTRAGQIDFGPEARPDWQYLRSHWYDRWLKGKETDVATWAPLRIFVMGANTWRNETEWPLARTRFVPYYFHSQTGANGTAGDGRLNTTSPKDEPPDRFAYDPNDPVPTRGGCNLTVPGGAFDQSDIEKRNDVLVYTSPVLTEDLEVTGPIKVILYAASTATDTDWTGKLVDVYPDGRAMNLCDGIIRARYRNQGRAKLIEPGKVYEYEINLWPTSNAFLKGHRIRVDISSSNFSRFDRNPNTGHTIGADTDMITARQTVYHSSEYPSHILLPVIPR